MNDPLPLIAAGLTGAAITAAAAAAWCWWNHTPQPRGATR